MHLRRATALMHVMFVCAREHGEGRVDDWETGGGGEVCVEIEEKSAHYITLARLPITPFKTFRALP